MRLVVIDHKLADKLLIGDKRKKCERPDAFAFDRVADTGVHFAVIDIVYTEWRRVYLALFPRRVARDGLSYIFR